MSDFTYWVSDDRVYAKTPYSREFVTAVKTIGGRWDASQRAWHVPADNADLLRDALEEAYVTIGDFPEVEAPTPAEDEVTIRLTLSASSYDKGLEGIGSTDRVEVAGRLVALRPDRDAPVRLGERVRLVEGEFSRKAGSKAAPLVIDNGRFGRDVGDPVTVDVLRVPLAQVPRWQEVGGEVLSAEHVNLEAIQARREKLLAELAELDAQIAALS